MSSEKVILRIMEEELNEWNQLGADEGIDEEEIPETPPPHSSPLTISSVYSGLDRALDLVVMRRSPIEISDDDADMTHQNNNTQPEEILSPPLPTVPEAPEDFQVFKAGVIKVSENMVNYVFTDFAKRTHAIYKTFVNDIAHLNYRHTGVFEVDMPPIVKDHIPDFEFFNQWKTTFLNYLSDVLIEKHQND